MVISSILLVIAVCLIIGVLGLGLPIFINQLVDMRMKRLEEATLGLAARFDAIDESQANLANFANQISWQQNVDRYNYLFHTYYMEHGEKDMEGIIKWKKQEIADEDLIRFRNWGIKLRETGQQAGYLPRDNNAANIPIF